MSFLSYAQNFEDIMLWRALKHVEAGFYIDVGANDPNKDSVTKAFYEAGWRGINIEPVAQWFDLLKEHRPRDVNLQLAIGATSGETTLFELPDTGLSTLVESIADRHELERGYQRIQRQIKVKTLTEVCEAYHVAPIHFLKIDVEGAEKEVLLGMDFLKIRPWIIVLESTLPLTEIDNFADWEAILIAAEYEHVYSDGLNRFYLAKEQRHLKPYFKVPPNYSDGFVFEPEHSFCAATLEGMKQEKLVADEKLNHLHQSLEEANYEQNKLKAILSQKIECMTVSEAIIEEMAQAKFVSDEKLSQLSRSLEEVKSEQEKLQVVISKKTEHMIALEVSVRDLNKNREELQAHSQWIKNELDTANARLIEEQAKTQQLSDRLARTLWHRIISKFKPVSMRSRIEATVTLFLAHARLYINLRPKLKRLVMSVLTHFPKIKQHLRRRIHINSIFTLEPIYPTEVSHLNEHEKAIYLKLKISMQQISEEKG